MSASSPHPLVHFRQAPDALAEHVKEAVVALGYFREDRIGQLVKIYEAHWPKGVSATMLRLDEIESLLTAKGAGDWRHAAKATTLRAQFNLRRQEFDDKEPEWSNFCSRLRFAARAQPQYHCDASRDLDGTVVERSERCPLPLPGCDREWCPCRWDWAGP